MIPSFYRMISIVHINFVNKLNFDVFIKNVIMVAIVMPVYNCTTYGIEPKESTHIAT